MIANITLVNLMIAMFNKTYSEVEAESLQLWRLQSWSLLEEYGEKPFVPPPLSVFYLLYIFGKWILDWCICCQPKRDRNYLPEKDEDSKELEVRLDRFEEKHTDRFMEKRANEGENEAGERIGRLESGMKELRLTLVDLHSVSKRQEQRLIQLLQQREALLAKPRSNPLIL